MKIRHPWRIFILEVLLRKTSSKAYGFCLETDAYYNNNSKRAGVYPLNNNQWSYRAR